MPDTGAPYFIPYVEPSDLVRDYPGASEDLADAIVAALEGIPVLEKRIEAFTGSGTFTVPAGVTYAIAHMLGGGGGMGVAASNAGDGVASSVAFASGTVTSNGGHKGRVDSASTQTSTAFAGKANTGRGAFAVAMDTTADGGGSASNAGDSTYIVAGAAVTPAASITVTVGAGGAAGSSGAAGGSGYVYIEYFEEV